MSVESVEIAPRKSRFLILPTFSEETPPVRHWRYLWPILFLGLALRSTIALMGDFVIHPDEIMQYLEPAHFLVFDRGVLHWEYYHGARSWFLPGFIAGILWLCQLAGLDQPAFYTDVVKVVFCLISMLIPYSMYVVGRHLFGEMSGRIALVFGAFWYELVVFAHKPMSEFVATGLIFFLFAFVVRPTPASVWRPAAAAIFGVLACAIRFHYLPVAGLILLVKFLHVDKRARIAMISAGAVGLLGVGLFELITWGGFFHSYRINFLVNFVWSDVRNEETTLLHFPAWLTVASGGLFLLATVLGGILWRRQLLVVALIASILLPHMWENHREYRFVFFVIPLWLMVLADALAVFSIKIRHGRWLVSAGVGCFAAISVFGANNAPPKQYGVYLWGQEKIDFLNRRQNLFDVYLRLATDSSVEGVLDMDESYPRIPGYYYLHRGIPLYALASEDLAFIPKLDRYVSHIIVRHQVVVGGFSETARGRYIIETQSGNYPLPKIVHDKETDRLVYWSEDKRKMIIEGFELIEVIGDIGLWRRINKDVPVPQWKRYAIFPNYPLINSIISRTVPEARTPPQNYGIELADP